MKYTVFTALLATWAIIEVKGHWHGFGHHHMHGHRGWHGGHGFPGHHHGHHHPWHHQPDCGGWGCNRETTTTTPPTTTLKPETETNQQEKNTSNTIPDCLTKCVSTPEYSPVCGTDGQTYNNIEGLNCAKSCGINVELKINSVCPPSPGSDEQGQRLVSTAAPTTTTVAQTTDPATGLTVFQECMKQCEIPSEYKPVCGTDLTTYFNIDRLNCAKRCTQEIKVLCDGSCNDCNNQKPITPSTMATPQSGSEEQCLSSCPGAEEIIPVCGSNGVTYNNPTELLCAQFCGQDVRVVQFAACTPSSLPTWSTSIPVAPTTSQPLKISTSSNYEEYPDIDIRFLGNTNQVNTPTEINSDRIVFPE